MIASQDITLLIDHRRYQVEVQQAVELPTDAPRLLIVAYQPNRLAAEILRLCLEGIRHFTPQPHEVWVIDNCSPPNQADWLRSWSGINVAFNRTAPRSSHWRDQLRRISYWLKGQPRHPYEASYANAIGLEIGARLISPQSQWLMPLHMDTLPCHPDWLAFLQQKMDAHVRQAGFHLQRSRVPAGVLHVLGFLVDFQLFRHLALDFFPQLPAFDVGDRVTVRLRQAGYQIFACRDTLNDPGLSHALQEPARDLPVLRAVDDQGRVIFMHLGRGVRKSTGEHGRGVTPQQWIDFARTRLLV